MLDHILLGTLPGWPEAPAPNWLLLLAICVALPFAVLGLFTLLYSRGQQDPEVEARARIDEQRALEQARTAETANVLEEIDESTPNGPNRALAAHH